jgi:hypothetical protein
MGHTALRGMSRVHTNQRVRLTLLLLLLLHVHANASAQGHRCKQARQTVIKPARSKCNHRHARIGHADLQACLPCSLQQAHCGLHRREDPSYWQTYAQITPEARNCCSSVLALVPQYGCSNSTTTQKAQNSVEMLCTPPGDNKVMLVGAASFTFLGSTMPYHMTQLQPWKQREMMQLTVSHALATHNNECTLAPLRYQ